jgi:hypothetical protein
MWRLLFPVMSFTEGKLPRIRVHNCHVVRLCDCVKCFNMLHTNCVRDGPAVYAVLPLPVLSMVVKVRLRKCVHPGLRLHVKFQKNARLLL